MKIFFILLTLLTLNTTSAHCPLEFSEVNLCGQVSWTHGPFINKASHFTLDFWQRGDASHTPVEPSQDINLYSWMVMETQPSHPGPTITLQRLGPGRYFSDDVRLFLHNPEDYWLIRVELFNEDSIVSESSVKIDLDSAAPGNGHDHGHHH